MKKQDDVNQWLETQRLNSALSTNVDFESRTLYLCGEIEDEIVRKFQIGLSVLDSSPGPITLWLNSSGGAEPAGFAAYDLLKIVRNPVTIIGTGAVMSMAALILQGGSRRLLTPECRVMIHNGTVEVETTIDQDSLAKLNSESKKASARYHHLLAARSGKQLKRIRELCEAETYFSAKEAVRMNLADAIVGAEEKKP
jgi:ATP-dependent Clp protease, protease subunit